MKIFLHKVYYTKISWFSVVFIVHLGLVSIAIPMIFHLSLVFFVCFWQKLLPKHFQYTSEKHQCTCIMMCSCVPLLLYVHMHAHMHHLTK